MAKIESALAKTFYQIDPPFIMRAAEKAGFLPTGEYLQLNSYENRVFAITLEGAVLMGERRPQVILKCYRPERWEKSAILEEHQFTKELKDEGFLVAAPHLLPNGSTLIENEGIYISFFPKLLGRMPQEFFAQDYVDIGRKLAHLHSIGQEAEFSYRGYLNESPLSGYDSLESLEGWVVPEIWPRYKKTSLEILDLIDDWIDTTEFQRIHGDCHRGNLLTDTKEFSFIDFDDCVMGPVVQDIWMLLSSLTSKDEEELVISGYETLREFPEHQLAWIPLLRALRIISYSAWIAKRWSDPMFPNLFPQFQSYNYWAQEIEVLDSLNLNFNG